LVSCMPDNLRFSNFEDIILLPKINDAERIQQYMPIFLLIVCFKIFTKVATIKLNSVVDHVVRPTQTAFMQGRYILECVVTLHETIHELHHKDEWISPHKGL
jgi:hypothetical protein